MQSTEPQCVINAIHCRQRGDGNEVLVVGDGGSARSAEPRTVVQPPQEDVSVDQQRPLREGHVGNGCTGVESGVVIQQKPQAGYRLSKNDIVLLDVSQ